MSEYDETTTGQARELAPIDDIAEEQVRKVLHDGRWWFAVVDVVGILSESSNSAVYWRVLKKRMMEDEGAQEAVTKCNALKMQASQTSQP